jgi:UDP-glucose 4-epimerase
MVLSRIGITGATGMLGRHVRAALEAVGAHVVATSRESVPASNVSSWDLSHWLCPAELDTLFNEVQAVIHVGAMVPRKPGAIDEAVMFDANVRSCVNLGQWAISRNIPLVHVSGAIVYEDQDNQGRDEDAALGWNGLGGFYGFSKLLAEDVLNRLCQQGLKLAVVRPSSIYGVGLPDGKMLTSFLATARTGGTITLAPPVDDRIDFIHAADVSLAILRILKGEMWDVFNIASGCLVSVRELAEACVAVSGRGTVVTTAGQCPARKPSTRFALDTGRARLRLAWQPLIDIGQGLTMMLKGSLYSGVNQSG